MSIASRMLRAVARGARIDSMMAAIALALTAFGWYYAYDATIYLVTGVLQQKPLGENIGLNIPHVIISGIMLWLAYRGRSEVTSPSAAVTA